MSAPNHLAIIPDGNRRWAKAQGLFPWQGHEEGVKRFWEVAQAAADNGVKFMTFWAGSYGNLAKRSEQEVGVLFRLMAEELSKPTLLEQLQKNQTKLVVIGEWESFAKDDKLRETLDKVLEQTKDFNDKQLTILFGYDGQREMLAGQESLRVSGQEITPESLQKHLWTSSLPDVDFVVRTGGEPHWSAGFLMWQTANSQLYFTDELWPAFTSDKLKTALEDFERRERRLGK